MLKPEKNLRWLGIDMRPRWRRRIAVIVTYVAFALAVAVVGDGGWGHPYITMIVLVGAVLYLGIFSNSGPVKSFEVPQPGTFGSKYVLVNGLDDLARYRYGVACYDAASEEQKSDLLQTYHVGTRLFPRKPALDEQTGLSERDWVDEREKQERVLAERWARRWLLTMLGVTTGRYLWRHTPVQPLEVVADLLSLGVLAATLAQARILWTEPDPRDAAGEIELVANSSSN
jgi:hypothetical protein